MAIFEIVVQCRVEEIYEIDAETEEEAREYWSEGTLLTSDNLNAWVESVNEVK